MSIDNIYKKIPEPALRRLCGLYGLLEELEQSGEEMVSSREIGERLGIKAHNVRKDISFLGEGGTIGAGYSVEHLKGLISNRLGFKEKKKAGIIGLGLLGQLILNYEGVLGSEYEIVAGFDSNINRLETMKTTVPLYPLYEMEDVLRSMSVFTAFLTLPAQSAQSAVDRAVNAGVRGVLNFSAAVVNSSLPEVCIRNIDLAGEFRFLISMMKDESLQ